MNVMNQFKKDCLASAALVGNYMDYTQFPKNETLIANSYIEANEAGDELKKNGYMAMLMLRHWKDIAKLYRACRTTGNGFRLEDYISVVHNRIIYALHYQKWNKNPKLNAQQCINQSISTERLNQFYYSNLDKNRANVGTVSMSSVSNIDSDDKEMTLADSIADDLPASFGAADGIIRLYTKKNKLIEAIILDTIAHNATIKTSSEKVTYQYYEKNTSTGKYEEVTGKGRINYQQFWRTKTAKLLKSLPETYEKKFAAKFNVPYDKACLAANQIRTSDSLKVYKYLDNTIADLRSKPELVAELMN